MLKKEIVKLKNSIVNVAIIRKPSDLNDLKQLTAKVAKKDYESVQVDNVIEYSNEDYLKLAENFFTENEAFREFGGYTKFENPRIRCVVAIYSDQQPLLVVDSQGYDYARYVGILNI